jgi:Cell Wall Hydrolase
MAPELGITPASPWLEPVAIPHQRRGPGWRFWAVLAAVVLFALVAVTISARGIRPMAPREPYRVSVAVDFKPYDPALWAIMNAEGYEAALALDPSLPSPDSVDWTGALAAPDSDMSSLREEAYVGPPAKAYVFRGVTPLDRQRAHYCLTAAIYYEAASETDDGMRGVAQTVLNRVRHPSFPNTVCGVVFQGSQRAGVCQFTFSCDGAMARAPSRANWARAPPHWRVRSFPRWASPPIIIPRPSGRVGAKAW